MQQAWNVLRQQWQTVTPLWQDQVRRQFEQRFWQPLESQMPALLQEMDNLARVIEQAQRAVR
jgi:hypothetical protein